MSYSLKKVDELKELCRARKLKIAGKKADLIHRLEVYEKLAAKGPTPVEKKFGDTRRKICLRRNARGLFIHSETGLVFDEVTRRVVGKESGENILPLSTQDVETAREWYFEVEETKIKIDAKTAATGDRLEDLISIMRGEKEAADLSEDEGSEDDAEVE